MDEKMERTDFQPCHQCHGQSGNECGECGGVGLRVPRTADAFAVFSDPVAIHAGMLRALAEYLFALDEKLASVVLPTLDEAVASNQRDLDERDRRSRDFWGGLQASQKALREEVKTLRQMVTGKMAPDDAVKESILGDPEATSAAKAIRLMVQAELREVVGNETFGPVQLRDHLQKLIEGQMEAQLERMIAKEIGLDAWGRLGTGPLKDAIVAHIEPFLRETVNAEAPQVLEGLDLPAKLKDWQRDELRDLFVQTLASTVRKAVVDRAVSVATEAVSDTVDEVVREEFPFLNRYLAAARLGGLQESS